VIGDLPDQIDEALATARAVLPEPPAADASTEELDAYLDKVKALTVRTVALVLPLESARQALLACQHVEENLALAEGDERVAPLRDAIGHLSRVVEERVTPDGREDFVGALVDDPTATDAQRIHWLRICLASFRQEREPVPAAEPTEPRSCRSCDSSPCECEPFGPEAGQWGREASEQ
jgi:hypothetical protein